MCSKENFCPLIWPEEPTPKQYVGCDQCGLIKHGNRMIWGEGNPHAPIFVLLDNPGAREDIQGKPFVCGTRQTMQKAINEVGLRVEHVYVTYVLKRRPTRSYHKKETRSICMNHTFEQLHLKKPRLICCLGNTSLQTFMHDEEVEVKHLRGTLFKANGFETTTSYHPLAVRRRPNLWKHFVEDWKFIADFVMNDDGHLHDFLR